MLALKLLELHQFCLVNLPLFLLAANRHSTKKHLNHLKQDEPPEPGGLIFQARPARIIHPLQTRSLRPLTASALHIFTIPPSLGQTGRTCRSPHNARTPGSGAVFAFARFRSCLGDFPEDTHTQNKPGSHPMCGSQALGAPCVRCQSGT